MAFELDNALGGLRLDEIHSFVVLAEELHFANAAHRLHLTSGGLSRRISHLEDALGTTLLLRTTRSVQLSPHGVRFAPAAERLMADLAQMRETLGVESPRISAAKRPGGHLERERAGRRARPGTRPKDPNSR